ncbi:MAG: alpha-hydroxy-acid oxidizing protein [Proteobacteria bacterium]|nr:alpha-hydroxy-acid oxidizing protein [Pseudomonadota bacterium]MBI3496945.1 alpha-hydroxy-acid oxidizing protein [Pseudomonadota bacterium]
MNSRLARAHSIADLRQMARRRLPKPIFDFVDGGAEDEVSLRHNRAVFERVRFRARTVVDVAKRSQSVDLFDRPSASPFGIAPMGGLGLLWPEAEIQLVRAASAAGIPFVLSTASNTSLERVAEHAGQARLWFQLYTLNDQRVNLSLIRRAAAAGYEALVVTTDTNMFPKRERDRRNQFTLALKKTPGNVFNILRHPSWLYRVGMRPGLGRMENLIGEVEGPTDPAKLVAYFMSQRNPTLDWDFLRPLREAWKGPMLLKGIMSKEEAIRAADFGMDGVILSNHGGRNLDSAVAPFEILPEIVDAVGARLTVCLDSGFRRGSDVLKAVAMGARMAFLGRPAAFAVAAAGPAGAEHLVALLKDEIDRVQGYLGCPTLDMLDRSYLWCDGLAAGRFHAWGENS